jgi:hypothetical protein
MRRLQKLRGQNCCLVLSWEGTGYPVPGYPCTITASRRCGSCVCVFAATMCQCAQVCGTEAFGSLVPTKHKPHLPISLDPSRVRAPGCPS